MTSISIANANQTQTNTNQPTTTATTYTKVPESISKAFKTADDFVTKKVDYANTNGLNPFGGGVNKNGATTTPRGDMEKQFVSRISKMDTDNNGFISRKELVAQMEDPNVKGKDAAMVGTLLEHQTKIQNLSNDEVTIEIKGISKNDMLALDSLKGDNDLKGDVEGLYYSNMWKVDSSKSLYDKQGNLKLPTKASDVNFNDIHQGSIGDCYFLASLASLAQRHPEKIVDMIHDNKNGTYNVKFANKTVTITAPTPTELGMYSSEGKAAWVPIIEKAYAHMRNETNLITKTNPFDASGKGSSIVGRGIKELTGNWFDTDLLKVTSDDKLRSKLINAQNNNKLMVTCITKELFGKNKFELPDAHVYTVLGYDEKTDKVKIRNPWGEGEGNINDGKDDGIFELSLADFKKTYSQVAFEK